MKVAVVTPYHSDDYRYIGQCRSSVINQTVSVDHIVVCDGCCEPANVTPFDRAILLNNRYNDFGNFPRGFGALIAYDLGYDVISFLDADNFFHPKHIERALELGISTKNTSVCASGRVIVSEHGELIGRCEVSNGIKFADTSTITIFNPVKELLAYWLTIRSEHAAVGDRIFFDHVRRLNLAVHWTGQHTVAYRARSASFYRQLGLTPVKGLRDTSDMIRRARVAYEEVSGIDLALIPELTPVSQITDRSLDIWSAL